MKQNLQKQPPLQISDVHSDPQIRIRWHTRSTLPFSEPHPEPLCEYLPKHFQKQIYRRGLSRNESVIKFRTPQCRTGATPKIRPSFIFAETFRVRISDGNAVLAEPQSKQTRLRMIAEPNPIFCKYSESREASLTCLDLSEAHPIFFKCNKKSLPDPIFLTIS